MYSSETIFLNKVLCNCFCLREIIFSDCIKAQYSVSSGTFLLLFFFTAQWQSPPVFSLSLLHWFLLPYLLEENHWQIMLMVYQIWSCEAICPSIPKFHLAKPTQFLPLPPAPIPSKKKKKKKPKKKTNTTSGKMNTSRSPCLLPRTSGQTWFSHLSLKDRKQILKRI